MLRRGFFVKPGVGRVGVSRVGWELVSGGSGVLSLLRSCTWTVVELRPDPETGPLVHPRDMYMIIRRIFAGEEF